MLCRRLLQVVALLSIGVSCVASNRAINGGGGGAWPPWPFNVLLGESSGKEGVSNNGEPSAREIFGHAVRNNIRDGARQFAHLTSQSTKHVSPSGPPILLLALLPREMSRSLGKKLALFTASTTVLAWSSATLTASNKLGRLKLPMYAIHSDLPPHLPAPPEFKPVSSSSASNYEPPTLSTMSPAKAKATFKHALDAISSTRVRQKEERTMLKRSVALAKLEARPPKPDNRGGYALVTGASKGIGREIAISLARRGMSLILTARGDLKAVAKDVKKYGVDAKIVQCDLAQPGGAKALYDKVEAMKLDVDVLVNNAGVSVGESTMIELNVAAPTRLAQLFASKMSDKGRGRILFVSSVMGSVPAGPGASVYGATKAYEKSLALGLRQELAQKGIGVSVALPGCVDTGFKDTMSDAICWRIPGFVLSAHRVAESSVSGLLAGDAIITPGWMNRVFQRAVVPMLPISIVGGIVKTAWSPVPWAQPPPQEQEKHNAHPMVPEKLESDQEDIDYLEDTSVSEEYFENPTLQEKDDTAASHDPNNKENNVTIDAS